jgi:hypothetical protein
MSAMQSWNPSEMQRLWLQQTLGTMMLTCRWVLPGQLEVCTALNTTKFCGDHPNPSNSGLRRHRIDIIHGHVWSPIQKLTAIEHAALVGIDKHTVASGVAVGQPHLQAILLPLLFRCVVDLSMMMGTSAPH